MDMHHQVELQRTFKFKHSGREWTGIPLIVANMDTVGTFEMGVEMARHKAQACTCTACACALHHVASPHAHRTTGAPRARPSSPPTRTTACSLHIRACVHTFKALVAVHKHYSVPEWRAFATAHPECLPYVAVSAGTSQARYLGIAASRT